MGVVEELKQGGIPAPLFMVCSGNIYEDTASGVRTTFASGLAEPEKSAVRVAGQLILGDRTDWTLKVFRRTTVLGN